MDSVIVYSHGFGVKKDDRGLFTDISAQLTNYRHILFDYNTFDTTSNLLTVTPLTKQAQMLDGHIREIALHSPNTPLTIIAHSQGCISAALARPMGLDKIFFLAPPAQMLGIEKKNLYKDRPGTRVLPDDTILYPRRDGTTTVIQKDYWESREGINAIDLYNSLAETTELHIIIALEDEVLTSSDFTGASGKITLHALHADHDFTGEARPKVIELISELL